MAVNDPQSSFFEATEATSSSEFRRSVCRWPGRYAATRPSRAVVFCRAHCLRPRCRCLIPGLQFGWHQRHLNLDLDSWGCQRAKLRNMDALNRKRVFLEQRRLLPILHVLLIVNISVLSISRFSPNVSRARRATAHAVRPSRQFAAAASGSTAAARGHHRVTPSPSQERNLPDAINSHTGGSAQCSRSSACRRCGAPQKSRHAVRATNCRSRAVLPHCRLRSRPHRRT